MTISVTGPATWNAGAAAHSSNRAHHPNHGGTPFDQQLQTPQSPQPTQANPVAGGTSPMSAGASLATDMIRMIASHVDAAVGTATRTG